jgi:hypothetical protein
MVRDGIEFVAIAYNCIVIGILGESGHAKPLNEYKEIPFEFINKGI